MLLCTLAACASYRAPSTVSQTAAAPITALTEVGKATAQPLAQTPANKDSGVANRYILHSANLGSDALYTPASAFFDYTFDTLQLKENFDTDNFNEDLSAVWDRLRHPHRSIDQEGGWRRFVNREIFPIDSRFRRDSFAALPNYGLHLLGGGMAYRRDLEWFRQEGYRYPRLAATTLAMVSEVLQEALEVQNTTDADAIADVYLFRPLGILLFSQDRIAKAVRRHLDPAIWPAMTAIDLRSGELFNTGIAYLYRPPRLAWGNRRLLVLTGLNNLVGLSHRLGSGADLSWGVGVAVKEIERQRDIQADVRPSLGVFYDRSGSLIWSAVVNDSGDQRFRLNLFPGAHRWLRSAGVFVGINDKGVASAGIHWRLPLGAGSSIK